MAKLLSVAAFAICTWIGAASAAEAAAIPSASTDVTLGGTSYPDNPGTYATTFDYSGVYVGGSAGTMTGTAVLSPAPLVSLSVTSCCSDYGHGQARVGLTYYAELTGPTGVTVPMELFEHLTSTESGSDAYGWAEAEADGATIAQEILFAGGGDVIDGNAHGSTPGVLRFDATTGQLITISLTVNGGALNGSTSSTADPYLTIDPSFASLDPNYASDYSLSFSPGIVNALGAVPEPTSWAMMLLGFAAIGLSVRRKSAALGDRPDEAVRI